MSVALSGAALLVAIVFAAAAVASHAAWLVPAGLWMALAWAIAPREMTERQRRIEAVMIVVCLAPVLALVGMVAVTAPPARESACMGLTVLPECTLLLRGRGHG